MEVTSGPESLLSLQQRVLEFIETNFDKIPGSVPSPVALQLLDYLMKRRKVCTVVRTCG